MERCISRETVVRFFPKNRWVGISASACLGLVFPMCECGIVPVVRFGQLVGLLTTENVGEFLMIQAALRTA